MKGRIAFAAVLATGIAGAAETAPVTFYKDVLPVLQKLGVSISKIAQDLAEAVGKRPVVHGVHARDGVWSTDQLEKAPVPGLQFGRSPRLGNFSARRAYS